MAEMKKLTVTGYIIRDGKKIKRKDLPIEEQKRLANAWNNGAMKDAGFVPVGSASKQRP